MQAGFTGAYGDPVCGQHFTPLTEIYSQPYVHRMANDDIDPLLAADPALMKISVRAANEGIPIASIARILAHGFDAIHEWLSYALSIGQISQMPRPDWPPTAKWNDRLPAVPRAMNPEDAELQCTRVFKLTPLESGFLIALLQNSFVSKETLHGITKHKRMTRMSLPNSIEDTDPKIVDVIICKLRKKLREFDAKLEIQTVRSKGYFFEPSVKQKLFDMVTNYGDTGERA